MLDCKIIKGPCTPPPVPPPPPCPPPPPRPFPWLLTLSIFSFFAAFGMMYKFYLWRQEAIRTSDKVIWRPRRKNKNPFHNKDLPACVQYLIIGGGGAAWGAYKSIMENDKQAKVFFITREDSLPYKRTPLGAEMWWNTTPPDLQKLQYVDYSMRRKTMYFAECKHFMDPVLFYRKKRGPAVSLASGWCVIRIEPDEHVVWVRTMCGDQPIYYERCLLAPGSKPKNLDMFKKAPASVRERVTTIRVIRDLEIAYRKVQDSKHVVVIGGGPLGTQLAYYIGRMKKVHGQDTGLPQEKLEVVHVYKDGGVLSGLLPEYLGEWAAEKIRCQGVTMMPKTQVYDAYESPDGRLQLTLSNGKTIVTDYAFLAVGAEPQTELAKISGLELDPHNGGYMVNTELQARTHLYIAGDAASFYSDFKDQRMRLEHYDNAEEMGNIAGCNMTGYWTSCNTEQQFVVRLGDDLEMEAVGEIGACMPTVGLFKECKVDTAYFTGDKKLEKKRVCFKKGGEYEAKFRNGLLFYLRDDVITGIVFWNMTPSIEDRMKVAQEIVRARPSQKDIDMIADLLGFKKAVCVFKKKVKGIVKAPVLEEEEPTCIKNRKQF